MGELENELVDLFMLDIPEIEVIEESTRIKHGKLEIIPRYVRTKRKDRK
jgi:hypothetical protein